MPHRITARHAGRLVLTAWLLSGGPSLAEPVAPQLAKTTAPVRVSPPTDATPSFELSHRGNRSDRPSRRSTGTSDDSLRPWLKPSPPITQLGANDLATAGPTRVNQFVELECSGDDAQRIAHRSAPSRMPHIGSAGEVRSNPLVADEPPTLRRFSMADRSNGQLPPANSTPEKRDGESAPQEQPGRLAIDCIGDHFPFPETDQEVSFPQRLRNDLVLPQTPPQMTGPAALEVEGLLSMDPELPAPKSPPAASQNSKTTLTERWASWSRKLGLQRDEVATQPASARRPSSPSTSTSQTPPPAKKSGGMFGRWFRR